MATELNITVPCQAAAGLAGPPNAGKTVLLSTVPKQAPKAVDRGLLIQRANDDLVRGGAQRPGGDRPAEPGAQPGLPAA